MISGDLAYNGMNLLLVVAALVSLLLLPKFVSKGATRRKVAVGMILLLVASIIFIVSLRIYRLQSVAYMGATLGKIDQEKFQFVDRFKNIALLGNLLELAAVAFLASAARALPFRRSGDSGKEGA